MDQVSKRWATPAEHMRDGAHPTLLCLYLYLCLYLCLFSLLLNERSLSCPW